MRFDNNLYLFFPDRFNHIGVVITIGILTYRLKIDCVLVVTTQREKEKIFVRISFTSAESLDLWCLFVVSFAASIDCICEDQSFLGTKIIEYKPFPGLKLSILI